MASEFSRITASLRPQNRGGWGNGPENYDPDAVLAVWRRLERFFKEDGLYPVEVAGSENMPEPPALLVANHSGGVLVLDAWGLGYAWVKEFGAERAIHSLVHEVPMQIRTTGERLSKLGGVRADRHSAQHILGELGRDLLVMPGGDRDVYRPYKDRYQVTFAGRRGYARLALRAGVPVVPVANSGAHATMLVLTDGQRIAERLQLRKLFRAGIFPISLSVPWGLTIGPLPYFPLPTRFRYRFGNPVTLPETFKRRINGGGEPTDEAVEALDQLVRQELQRLLDALKEETPRMRDRLRHGLRI